MKHINWKILFITSALCLLMILPGAIFWESLPEQIAIHFNIEGTPDNFTSKAFAVFLIYPALMVKRIRSEEQLLEAELPGYTDYQKKVKYRMIPFLW